MYLSLNQEQAQTIIDQSTDATPYEVCGVLAGTDDCQVKEVIRLPNVATQPDRQFRIDDKALSETLFWIQRSELTLLGFYHSHPRSDPVPSAEDIHQANYPDSAYLIVSLRHSPPRLAAWSIRFQQVTPVDLYIDWQPPASSQGDLSQSQKAAIMLSAIIAFIVILVVSLALLPPAPIIPAPLP